MNPFWVGPYEIVKHVGPVNWAILERSTGKSKIVHHNLIKPALIKQDASILPTSSTRAPDNPLVSRIMVPQSDGSGIGSPNNSGQSEGLVLNRQQFTNNVFSGSSINNPPDPLSVPAPAEYVPVQYSRSGRQIKPVSRLIDEVGHG